MLHATRAPAVRALAAAVTVLAATAGVFPLAAQEPAGGLTLITPRGRQPLATVDVQGGEAIPLDRLAALFRLDVEDTGERTLTVNTGGGPIVLTAGQPLASVAGQLVSLDAPARRVGGRWFVPLDFIGGALARVHGQRLELRARSRLLLVGDVRAPRVSAQYRPRARSGRLTLRITPNTAYEVTEEDGRILVRLEADAIDLVRAAQPRGEAVRSIELLDELPGFAIEPGPSYASHRIVSGEAGASTQLVVDLEAAAPAVAEARPAAEPAEPEPDAASGDALPVPDFGAPTEIRTVVIDPGHGGADEGARGPEGTLEKDVTLSVARRLRALLERRLGVRVILTRAGDTLVTPDRRAAAANNNRADLFISLHANAALRDTVTGAEVYHLGIDEYGREARELAAREGRYLPVSGGGVRDVDVIPWEMAQARHLAPSADLAAFVSEELGRRVPLSPRPVREAPFRVLAGANMPAILVEAGFLSNPDQELQMTRPDFQALVAEAVVAGVIRFRDHLASAPYAPSAEIPADESADAPIDGVRGAGERD